MQTCDIASTPKIPALWCLPAAGEPKEPALYDAGKAQMFAIMGGAYGNVPSFTACIRHARGIGCDGFAYIGDATGCCGHSDEILQLVRDNFPFLVAGNYEQKAADNSEDCGCNYSDAEDEYYGGIAHRWAMRSLNDANRQWLGAWPDLAILQTTAGRVLLCHGSPGQTNEFLYESQLDDARLMKWLEAHEAIGMVCGHSGFPWLRSLPDGKFAINCGVCGKPDHDHDAAVHYATVTLREGAPPVINIERVEYDHLAWADQLYEEGVDDVFSIPVRNGVWTCGLMSMPATERVLRPRPLGWLQAMGK